MYFQVKLSTQDYHVNRLTHKNKRWCRDSTYTFSAAHQIETNQIRRNMTQAFTHGRQVTRSEGSVVFENHDAWTVLDDIKSTPRYWKTKKAELCAKLDNIGPFQWFFTLSCADKRWPATLVSVIQERENVRKVVTELITGEDGYTSLKTSIHTTTDPWPVDLDTFMERETDLSLHEVIRQNVIEATRYFDFRVKAFIKEVVMGGANPMAVQYYSYRVEFQARGAAHIHGVLWANIDKLEATEKDGEKHLLGLRAAFKALRDDEVPQHVERSKPIPEALRPRIMPFMATKALTNFIDEFITCSLHKGFIGEAVVLIAQEVQTHHHTKTCFKRGGSSCRFNYPKFPSTKTIIAKPYERVGKDKDDMDNAEKELAKVRKVLENKDLLAQVKLLYISIF